MKNYTDDKLGYVLFYPDNWEYEKEDNVLSIYDPEKGLGSLQLSAYHFGNDNSIDLQAELEEHLQDNHKSYNVQMIDDMAYSKIREGERVWEYWILLRGNILIFATYNCEIEDNGKESNEIKKILNSLAQNSIN